MSQLQTNILRAVHPYSAYLHEDQARRAELQLIGDEYVPVPKPVFYVPLAQKVIQRNNDFAENARPDAMAQARERDRQRPASVVAAQIISAGEIIKVARARAEQGDVSAARGLMASASAMIQHLSDLNPKIMRSPAVRAALSTVPDEYKSASQRLEVVHHAEDAQDERQAEILVFPSRDEPRPARRQESDLMAA